MVNQFERETKMPKIDRVVYSDDSKEVFRRLCIPVKVNSQGMFYAHVPAFLKDAIKGSGLRLYNTKKREARETDYDVYAETFAELEQGFARATRAFLTPERKVEHVIRFNIELHVSFSVDPNGETGRNAIGEKLSWVPDEAFGGHYAQKPAKGGYSVCVGARAKTKTTLKYGKHKIVKYTDYYAGGSHLGNENPAQKLNSWCSFSLPGDAREIPYSDEAALFFDRMMRGVVDLARLFHSHFGTNEDVQRSIEAGIDNLLPSGNMETSD